MRQIAQSSVGDLSECVGREFRKEFRVVRAAAVDLRCVEQVRPESVGPCGFAECPLLSIAAVSSRMMPESGCASNCFARLFVEQRHGNDVRIRLRLRNTRRGQISVAEAARRTKLEFEGIDQIDALQRAGLAANQRWRLKIRFERVAQHFVSAAGKEL